MRGKRRPKGKATALALVLPAAVFCAVPAAASADPPVAAITATSPMSPSSITSPFVIGTATPNSTVSVFDNSACSDPPLATGPADLSGSWEFSVTVPSNAVTTLYASASNLVDGTGPCSSSGFGYTEDSDAPPPPTVTSTNPSPPSSNNFPKVIGTAEAGSTVSVYVGGCTGTVYASGDAGTFGSGGGLQITTALPSDTPSQLFAKATDAAGNSSCSAAGFLYTEDSTPPAVAVTTTNPAPPSSNNTPRVIGTAEAGSAVSVYNNASCIGTVYASGNAATFGSGGGLQITTALPSDTVTQLYAKATDAAGNSSCSAAFAYTEDSMGPAAPTELTTSPPSPANSTSLFFQGTASTDSVSVSAYITTDCTGPELTGSPITRAAFASPGLPLTVQANHTTHLSAKAKDLAGNTGDCGTIDYVEDSTLPSPPTLTSVPASPANNNNPTLKGTSDPNTSVTVAIGTCSAHAVAFFATPALFATGFTYHVDDNTTTHFSARATDPATNKSACSTPLDYMEVTPAPSSGTLSATSSKCKKKSKSKRAEAAKKHKKKKHCKKKKHKKKKKKKKK